MTPNNFDTIARQFSDPKYLKYALSLTKNKEDAEDLIGDGVLIVHRRLEYFQTASESGYLDAAIKRVLKNLFITNCRAKKEIDKDLLSRTSAVYVRDRKFTLALDKLSEDQSRTDYYPLLLRRVVEWGGVKELSKASGVNENTLYTGLKKYRTDLMNIKKILLIADKNSAVGYHRIVKPYSELRGTRNDILVSLSNAYINKDHDIVVFNRLCGGSFEDERALIREMKICGQKVIIDIDDYWILPPGHHLEMYYQKNGITKRIMQNIREADMVTTTNEVLALKILPLNKNVVVLPNALCETDLQWVHAPQPFEPYRFGYAGSAAHSTDVPILRKACNLMHRGSQNFQMVLIGWVEGDVQKNLFEEVLTSRYTGKDKYMRIQRKPVEQYGAAYNFISCSLAPLADSLFNRCKSNLKILEASIHKVPIICSKIHPYFGSDFDHCVLFAENEYDWYKQMNRLLKDPGMGEKMAQAANEITLKRYTYKQITKLRSEII